MIDDGMGSESKTSRACNCTKNLFITKTKTQNFKLLVNVKWNRE